MSARPTTNTANNGAAPTSRKRGSNRFTQPDHCRCSICVQVATNSRSSVAIDSKVENPTTSNAVNNGTAPTSRKRGSNKFAQPDHCRCSICIRRVQVATKARSSVANNSKVDETTGIITSINVPCYVHMNKTGPKYDSQVGFEFE
jgi:hypothetical protein